MTPNELSIKSYFSGKIVFITGATGFLGKALTEKLLRSCPDLKRIYVLIRSKKNKSPEDRLSQMLNDPLFGLLKVENPKQFEKIKIVEGDITRPQLGITGTDRDILKNEVHVVFNAAASVRFDDCLKTAIFTNLRSCREAASLALEMKNIEVFLHVSTAFCNINDGSEIRETLYPSNGDWRAAIDTAENVDEHLLNVLTLKYIGENFPNTYTYTKHLGERCVNDLLKGKVPLGICRPTIVLGTLSEPIEGWLDNFYNLIGISVAAATGLTRILYADPENELDIIPVDTVVQGMIVTAWHEAVHDDRKGKEPLVVHVSRNVNCSFTAKAYLTHGKKVFLEVPLQKRLWYPQITLTTCWYKYFLYLVLFHLLPSAVLDSILKIFGRKPFLVKLQRKIYMVNLALEQFLCPPKLWKFSHSNMESVFDIVQDEEKKGFKYGNFPLDKPEIHDAYLSVSNYIRVNLLKEPPKISEATFRQTKWLYVLDLATKTAMWAFCLWLVLIRWNVALKIWMATLNYWSGLNEHHVEDLVW